MLSQPLDWLTLQLNQHDARLRDAGALSARHCVRHTSTVATNGLSASMQCQTLLQALEAAAHSQLGSAWPQIIDGGRLRWL